MSEAAVYNGLLIAWLALSAATFASLFFVVAPYGRHRREGWGPVIGDRWAWMIMEAPGVLVLGICFLLRRRPAGVAETLLLALWEGHYVYRVFIYPLRRRSRGKVMPLSLVVMGCLFNIGNGYLNGRALYAPAHPWGFSAGYGPDWAKDGRFLGGVALFLVGFAIHQQADRMLRALRRPGESDYRVPQGGLFRWVSCPNYLGEIVEWTGWAIATWSLAGLSFALWTAANLAPRAAAHHRWYREHFPDYPSRRKALLPGVW